MQSVPGIGFVTSAVVKAKIGDTRRFESPESLAAYAGLVPTTYQSGDKEWSGPTRHGNSRMKHVLLEATLMRIHICPDSKISRHYHRKRNAIGAKKAIVAAGRKMAETLYFMLERGEQFHAH